MVAAIFLLRLKRQKKGSSIYANINNVGHPIRMSYYNIYKNKRLNDPAILFHHGPHRFRTGKPTNPLQDSHGSNHHAEFTNFSPLFQFHVKYFLI
ncbi:hypothetical protein A2V82_10710 [candidate division KSB1 bacterium RBG_16_48_16]|nr:MAG: hypothetical protein A2V82_10710 [candidate division KSB1 bacterium RBG_16_48_16]